MPVISGNWCRSPSWDSLAAEVRGTWGTCTSFFRAIFTEKKIKKVLETGLNVPHVPHNTILRHSKIRTRSSSGSPAYPFVDALGRRNDDAGSSGIIDIPIIGTLPHGHGK